MMEIKIGDEAINLNVEEVKGFGLFRGLTFRRRENAPILLFNMKSGLHSFFVFFDFFVLWLDNENNILEYRRVKPWKFYIDSKEKYSKIVEIPISRRYSQEVKFVDGKDLKRNNSYNKHNSKKGGE